MQASSDAYILNYYIHSTVFDCICTKLRHALVIAIYRAPNTSPSWSYLGPAFHPCYKVLKSLKLARLVLSLTMPDPVAEKSSFLRMYMSSHPDTLIAYAKWFGKVNEVITSAEMSAIDCKVAIFLLVVSQVSNSHHVLAGRAWRWPVQWKEVQRETYVFPSIHLYQDMKTSNLVFLKWKHSPRKASVWCVYYHKPTSPRAPLILNRSRSPKSRPLSSHHWTY